MVDLTLSGPLAPRLRATPTGSAVDLLDTAGDTALRYDHLVAYDDAGTVLDSRLELHGDTISLVVDDTGATYPVVIDPLISTQQAELTAADAAPFHQFGAAVTVDGDTAVIGAYRDDTAGLDTGAAYVFVRTGAAWTQQAKLTPDDATAGDLFGISVALSGETTVIGASRHDDDAGVDTGAAYVFVREGATWTQQATVTAGDAAPNDMFGSAVAVSGDTAVIGAVSNDIGTGAGIDAGGAYVFERTGTTWTQQAALIPDDAAASDRFGGSVAISGETAVIGAYADNLGPLADTGSVYVFVRTGISWAQGAKLTAADAAPGDFFGGSVAISGETVLVGAAQDDSGAGLETGAAYVFARTDTTWAQEAKLTAADAAPYDKLGISVAISGDTAVAGAPFDADAGFGAGAAYVFERTGAAWAQQAKLAPADAAPFDGFGYAVAISGGTVLVGAPAGEGGGAGGSAYVFAAAPAGLDVDIDSATTDGVGRALQVTGTATCPAGATFNLLAVVDQGLVQAKGTTKVGTCTGAPQPFDLELRAHAGQTFVPGTTQACVRIETSEPGRATICQVVAISIP